MHKDPVKVFISVRPVMSRAPFPTPPRYVAEVIARGTGTVMYKSGPRQSVKEARELAHRAISQRGYEDTSEK